MSKPNDDNKMDVSQLYRLYQEQRDAVPSAMLRNLLAAAKGEERHDETENVSQNESQIKTILAAARLAETEAEVNIAPVADDNRSSLKQKIMEFLQSLLTPSFGGPQMVALSLVVVVALTITTSLMPSRQQYDPYMDVSYLGGCDICGQLAANSTIKLRSFNLNTSGVASESGAAKFGRFALGLELLNSLPADNNGANSTMLITAIKRLAEEKGNTELKKYFSQFDTTTKALQEAQVSQAVQFLNQTFSSHADADLFYAGQWLERLRISNESALRMQQLSLVEPAFSDVKQVQARWKQNKAIPHDVLSDVEKLAQFQQTEELSLENLQKISNLVKKILLSIDM